jgi:WXG100 family type VII secretion target
MASYTQQYDTDGMRAKAAEIKALSGEYEQVMSRLTTLVNNLDQVWNASATRTFQASYTEFQSTFANFAARMMNYSEELTLAANEQDQKNQADINRAARING